MDSLISTQLYLQPLLWINVVFYIVLFYIPISKVTQSLSGKSILIFSYLQPSILFFFFTKSWYLLLSNNSLGVYKRFDDEFISLQLTADIYDRVEKDIKRMGLNSDCVGGGRIQHDKSEKKILVYGYSMVS